MGGITSRVYGLGSGMCYLFFFGFFPVCKLLPVFACAILAADALDFPALFRAS